MLVVVPVVDGGCASACPKPMARAPAVRKCSTKDAGSGRRFKACTFGSEKRFGKHVTPVSNVSKGFVPARASPEQNGANAPP